MIMMNVIVCIFAGLNMNMRMRMRRARVRVRMSMDDQVFAIRRGSAHPACEFSHQASRRADPEQYQHYGDREFHRESESGRNSNFEDDDRGAHQQHGEGMAGSPYEAGSGDRQKTAVAAQDGRHRAAGIGTGGL